MNSRFFSQASRRVFSLPSRVAGVGVLCLPLTGTAATIIKTSDPTVVAAFQSGASVENFDDLTAFVITSYDPGQFIDAGAKFSSRDGATMPTYHSGGASPNDPVGNPGTPIGIVDPDGGIAGDVASPNNVAAPLVINSDEPASSSESPATSLKLRSPPSSGTASMPSPSMMSLIPRIRRVRRRCLNLEAPW
jgi:hypothetical protein